MNRTRSTNIILAIFSWIINYPSKFNHIPFAIWFLELSSSKRFTNGVVTEPIGTGGAKRFQSHTEKWRQKFGKIMGKLFSSPESGKTKTIFFY